MTDEHDAQILSRAAVPGLDRFVPETDPGSAESVDVASREYERNLPTPRSLTGSGVMPSAGYLGIDLGGPMPGTVWDVRRLAVSGPDPAIAIAGTVYVCVGPVVFVTGGTTATGSVTDLRDIAQTIPLVSNWDSFSLLVTPTERLYAIGVGLAAAQALVVTAGVNTYRRESFRAGD